MLDNKNNNYIDELFSRLNDDFIPSVVKNEYYRYFMLCLRTGKNKAGTSRKYVEQKIVGDWLNAIEQTLIPLDNIIRYPRSYIKNIEDVVPIELAHGITTDSIKHLAQHTNLIAKIDESGLVIPEKILNVTKEESFDTYENRFVNTLLVNLEYFITKRLNRIRDFGQKDIDEYVFSGESIIGKEKLSYKINFALERTSKIKESSRDILLKQNVKELSIIERMERVKLIIFDFRESSFSKNLKDAALVRPPLQMTNVLTKNTDFSKCVDLWNFIMNYKDEGVELKMVEETSQINQDLLQEMYSMLPLQYSVLKKHSKDSFIPEIPDDLDDLEEQESSPTVLIKARIKSFVSNLDGDVEVIKKFFNEEIKIKVKKKAIEKSRLKGIVSRMFTGEKPWLAKEKKMLKSIALKQKQIEKEIKEELKRIERERKKEEKRLAEERARLIKMVVLKVASKKGKFHLNKVKVTGHLNSKIATKKVA